MSVATTKKRKLPNGAQQKAAFRPRKSQRAASYHSSSDEDEGDGGGTGVQLPNLEEATEASGAEGDPHPENKEDAESENDSISNSEDDSDVDDASQTSPADGIDTDSESDEYGDNEEDEDGPSADSIQTRKPRKRNDPAQFATSISKILSSKLTKDKRADPVLSRSKNALERSKELADERLEVRARRKLRDEKRAAQGKGREQDVLGLSREEVSAGAVAEEERQLKKTAQRGVVKLFNAVRAAQVKGEAAAREAQEKGMIGADRRQERVNEMSKQGFLDLLVDAQN